MTTTTRKFSAIGGLSNGYAISVNAGGNISDSLAIHTDGGQGVVSVKSGSVTGSFNVSGLVDGFKVSLTPKVSFSDEVTFKSNSAGTIASGNSTEILLWQFNKASFPLIRTIIILSRR